jgi:UDP-glucose 4-epimerase
MLRAVDQGAYYRVPADTRDLNYNAYFSEGHEELSAQRDYTSHNTHRLGVDEMIDMLLGLEFIQRELAVWQGREASK